MLLSLAQWLQSLSPEFGYFRVFQYLTFRAVMAALTALLIGLIAGPFVIRRLISLKMGQPIREYAMQTHLSKSGTPTMGGVLILLSIAIATLLWSDLSNRFVWIVLIVTLGFGAIGWADDWRKVVHKDPEGMRSREKYLWQSIIGLVAAVYLVFSISESSNLRVIGLFISWVQSMAKISEGQIVSIDGKRLCNSGEQGKKAIIHMVSAWSNDNSMVLGQLKLNDLK